MTPQQFSTFFAILGLVTFVGTASIVVIGLAGRGRSWGWWAEMRRYALGAAWVVATVAMLGSLYYSEIAGYTPCKLCWFQRIAMYPLALMLGVATFRRDLGVRWYAMPLAAIGAAVAGYHTWLQANPQTTSAFCAVDVPCTERHVWEFGFVSLPLLALSAFLFVLAALAVARTSTSPPADVP